MLFLYESWIPLSPETSWIDDHKRGRKNRIHHQRCDEVRKLGFLIGFSFEVDLRPDQNFKEISHSRDPFLLINGIDFGVWLDFSVVESIGNQLSSFMQFFLWNILTSSSVGKNLVTDCNGTLNAGLEQFCAIEFHVEDIEVEASVDGPKIGNS